MLPDIDKKPEKQLIVKMAGYLEKKSRMRVVGVRRWKKRWCVLEGKLLLYFKTQLEYSHQLSPCRGSVNMGLALSITPRGPCQLQIVTRSQIIIFRTKSKSEQDEWFAALRDARSNNQIYIKHCKERHSSVMEMHYRLSNQISVQESKSKINVINENHLRYGRSLKDSFEDIFFEVGKKNGVQIVRTDRRSSALRKSESDNRISFYREMHGLVRTETITTAAGPPISDKESCCRSRSLSYESIYFKPQDKSIEPNKSQSCRELVPKVTTRRVSKECTGNGSVSKRMSRSVSFFQRRCGDSDSDEYDYVIEVSGTKQKYSKPMTHIKESEQSPELPPRRVKKDEEIESMSTVAQSEYFPNQEANVDVIYVSNDRKAKVYTSESKSDLVLEYGTEQTVEVEDEPPPLPIKKKSKQDNVFEEKKHYQITDVSGNDSKEVIYDVPIPHGKLIEQFRRLSVANASPVKRRCADDIIYHDSLEPLIYETLNNITPDSLEITTFPTYKRWSNDSGFNYYEELGSFSPDQTHFEDSLEPVIAMINHDRKIWQNVPNINSTDYFR